MPSRVRDLDGNYVQVQRQGEDVGGEGFGVTVDNQSDPPAAVTTLIAPGAVISGDEATLAGGSLVWRSVTLQAADILALETTPFEIVPAPGGRKYIVPIQGIVHYRYNTTPYTGNSDNFVTGFGTTIADLAAFGGWSGFTGSSGSFAATDLLAQTADAYGTFVYTDKNAWLASELEDTRYVVAMSDGVGFAGGDGTLTVRLLYSIIDGAPPV